MICCKSIVDITSLKKQLWQLSCREFRGEKEKRKEKNCGLPKLEKKKFMASHNFGHSIDHCLFFPQLQRAIILFLFFSFLFFSFLFFLPYIFGNSIDIIIFFFSSNFGKPHSFFSSPLYFWQLNCHNFFFLSPQFWQLDCLNSFFSLSSLLQFQQLYCHNCFFFFFSLRTPPRQLAFWAEI